MNGRTAVAAVALALLTASVPAATRAYFVEPKELHEGWVAGDEQHGIRQTFVANVDSIAYIEWFVGELSAEGQYLFEIREQGTNDLVCTGAESVPTRGWQWVKCDSFSPLGSKRFVKGREYLLKVSHDGGDSVNFVYRTDNPYGYGQISVGGGGWNQAHPVEFCDLVCRIYGQLDPVDSTFWGMDPNFPWRWGIEKQRWVARCTTAGVGMIRLTQRWDESESLHGAYNWEQLDTCIKWIHRTAGNDLMLLVYGVPTWASTRIDTFLPDSTRPDTVIDSCVYCPPRNLWVHPDSAAHANHWASYLEALVKHIDTVCETESLEGIHDFEIWNEPNEGCTLSPSRPPTYPGYTGWWRRPKTHYTVSSDSLDMCSLYVRLCEVAANTIRSIDGHENDRILIGSLARVDYADPNLRLIEGRDWLRLFYDIATESGGPGIFWDGVSVHPYQTNLTSFSSDTFCSNADTLRAIMRENGHNDGELWNTELGWGTSAGEHKTARNLCKTYVSAKASEASLRARYDRTFWWTFRATHASKICPLMNDWIDTAYASFYACKQASSLLDGRRFNQRVLTGDAGDDTVRMYEFSDVDDSLRLWVCWRDKGSTSVEVRLPVRADTVYPEELAYDSAVTLPLPIGTAADGWLDVTLDSSPMFIREGEEWAISRPDVRVDSVAFQRPMLTAWVTNHGNRATPHDPSMPYPYPTWVVFYWDGDSVAAAAYEQVIGENQQVSVTAEVNEAPNQAGLFSAHANPNQLYVERYGLDDNAGYLLKEEE